ncbi:MAG: HAMP domain-containing histidine kinase [Bacteroidaceae bacterium]|nr:HAMP domain-containing histidine kinase [Bacteroidaceae bacterium]
MKLSHSVVLRLSLMAAFVLALWSVFFYFAVMDEVRDETDDSLEDYSELLIIRFLSGQPMPSQSIGSNNQYFLREVTADFAAHHPVLTYEDRSVFIDEKGEEEPARVLTSIFRTDDGRFMQLEVSTPSIDKHDVRMAIIGWLVFLYLTLMAAVCLCNYWVIGRSLRPLHRLLTWLKAYRIGKTNEPLENETRISEFRMLNRVTQNTIERSEKLFRQQKEFVGNASHEMQTPLAVACGRLEMLLDDETLGEERATEVFKTLKTLQRLSQINRSLLLLSKIDGGQFVEKTAVSIHQTLEDILPDFRTAYAHLHIRIEITCTEDVVWQMDPALATILLQNMIKNAYTHNHTDGEIHITLQNDTLCVANTGAAEPLDGEAIFTRFHHTPGKSDSTGLGLPIAQAICRNYDMEITYAFSNGLHAFRIAKT